jgi:hypothetical protein
VRKYFGRVIIFVSLLIFKSFIASLLCNQRLIQNSFPEEQKQLKPSMRDSSPGREGGCAKWH